MNRIPVNVSEWKHTKVCRCCLSDRCYKNLSTDYFNCGEKENYEEMLTETFNIKISQNNSGTTIESLICDDCVIRLRDAFRFRIKVLSSEETYANYLKNVFRDTEDPVEAPIKTEVIKIEALSEIGDEDNICEDSFDDNEMLSNSQQEMPRKETECKTKRKRKSQENKGCRKRKIKNKDENLEMHIKPEKHWTQIAERRGNGPILRDNSLKLLENSTICVFQWNKSRYRCFCCKEPFSDMTALKEHTQITHTLGNIEREIIFQQNRLVKVEVSSIHCKICDQRLENLIFLREHLIQTHQFKFELNDDLLIPFKIDGTVGTLQCQLCSEQFTMFRLLNIHMNRHYQKQVCHICGAGFSNLVFLNLHKTRSHRMFDCKQCDLSFQNKFDKKQHDVIVHNVKFVRKLRFPCPYCPERFVQENFRVQHLVELHGMVRPEHKCLVCAKVFITRSLCNNHVKKVHMKQRNQECDVCHNLFYTKSDLSRHKVTHTGEKKFTCSMCNNTFASKDSLRRHIKRTHVGLH